MLEHLVRDAVDLQPDRLEDIRHAIDQGVEQPGQHGDAPGVRPGRASAAAGEARVILFNLCGRRHVDMQACADYFAGRLTDQSYAEADLQAALAHLPKVA
jgi:hypothetical protein